MKPLIIFISVVIGIYMGKWIQHRPALKEGASTELIQKERANEPWPVRNAIRPSHSREELASQHPVLRDSVSIKRANEILSLDRKSPFRDQSLIGLKIESLTVEQLLQAMEAGEVATKDQLARVAERLATEIPEETFNRMLKWETKSMGHFFEFCNQAMETWVKQDSLAALEYLEEMDSRGVRYYYSEKLSEYWSKHDPRAAVEHYGQLVKLRNRTKASSLHRSDDELAMMIVKSWGDLDEAGMLLYIDHLSDGGKKRSMEKAYSKLVTDL